MITPEKSMETKLSNSLLTPIVSCIKFKQMIFRKTYQKMLEKDLIPLTIQKNTH